MNLRPGRLLGGGVNTIAHTLAVADFRAPLLTSLVPTRGAGAPSFTRATTATVIDNEGVLRTCLAGEARFTGARRVRNLWGVQSATLAVAASNTMTLPAGSYIFSMGAGAGTATFSGTGGATGTLAAGAGRTSVLKTISAGTLIVTGSIATLIDLQIEDVTAQSIQTAGEYVSVGVLSSPYHGSGVDGVKCFDTTLAGVPIPTATLKGYLAEGARTNLCLQSQVFDNASWVKSQTTVSTDATIAPDGTLTADKLVESATSGVEHYVEQIQSIVTNQTYAASLYVKAGELTQFAITIVAVGSTYTTSDILFAISAGVITSISGAAGLVSSSITVPVGKGWYRCILIYTLNGTVTSHRIRIYPRQVGLYLGDITKGLYVWGAQLEVGPTATSYIPTTTAAVTRNADVLTYPDTGNISNTAGTSYVEFSAAGVSGLTQQVLARDTNGRFPYINTFTDRTQLYDGTTQSDATVGASFINNTQKSAQSWGVGTKSVSYAGTAVVTSAYDGTQGTGAIAIGCNNSGTEGLGGNIRNVCIWLRKLPDAVLKMISK